MTARLRRIPLLLALLPALLGAASLVAPASASAVNTVGSGIVCTTYNASANIATVRFGYANHGVTIENLPPGDENFFFPPPVDIGQPNQFVPGNGSFDVTHAAGDPSLLWTISGGAGEAADFAVADLPFERPCPERGPTITGLTPPTVTTAGTAQLAIFGQGLAGGTVTVAGEGVTATTAGPGTEQRLDATVSIAPDAAPGPRDVLVTAPGGDQVGCRGCLEVEAAPAPPAPERGPAGDRGPAGERGAPGPAGPAGASAQVVHVKGTAVTLGADGTATAVARCPAGRTAIAGGYALGGKGAPRSLAILADQPRGAAAWAVTVAGGGGAATRRLTASVSCLG